jgi:hypothetical protein
MSQRFLAGLVEFAMAAVESGAVGATIAVGGAIGVFGILFIPSKGPHGQWIEVGGPGNISYFHNLDEHGYKFRFTPSDGIPRTINASPDPNGDFRGPDGRLFGRLIKAAGKVGVVISTSELLGQDNEEPKLCPKYTKDRGGEAGAPYEDYAKALYNPGNPTPHKMAYKFYNPATKQWVNIDDCQQKFPALAEYKGPGYSYHFQKKDFIWDNMKKEIIEQSLRQYQSRGGRPLTWYVEERDVSLEIKQIFKDNDDGREHIGVAWWPWPGNPRK